MKRFAFVTLLAGAAALAATAQQTTQVVPGGKPLTIHVLPAPPSAPSVSITLGKRQAIVTPHRQGICHTGGGNIDVAQPSSDTVVITMSGVAAAVGTACGPGVAGMDFDLNQEFEISFEKPEVKMAKLTLEGRIIGLLRSHKIGSGSAEESHGCASVLGAVIGGKAQMGILCVPDQYAAGGDNRSINAHEGPTSITIAAGQYTLHQIFHIMASHPRCLLPCKAASAEFAPDPALDPLWISYWEPFHGASKKDFGFQVTVKVAPETEPARETIPAVPRKLNGSKGTE